MCSTRLFRTLTLCTTTLCLVSLASAAKPDEQDPNSAIRLAQANPPKKKFFDGIVTTIKPELKPNETFSKRHSIIELTKGVSGLTWTPSYFSPTRTLGSKANEVTLRRDIWGLEFSFKPLRMMKIDVPQPTGKMQRKLIWYMVFNVKNYNDPLRAVPTKDQNGDIIYQAKKVDGLPSPGIRFYPRFVLETQDTGKAYLDRVIPLAADVIAERETGGSKLYNTVNISRFNIPVSTAEEDNSVWGVVTWEDIDPETDFLSLYIQGLTNAYKFEDDLDSYQPGDEPGKHRKLLQKTLKINFWRPGDKFQEHEDEIRLGVPKRPGIKEQVDYEWIYR